MFGFETPEPEYDAICESCGVGYWFDVGMNLFCRNCGGPATLPKNGGDHGQASESDDREGAGDSAEP